jgi:hypothetical protein
MVVMTGSAPPLPLLPPLPALPPVLLPPLLVPPVLLPPVSSLSSSLSPFEPQPRAKRAMHPQPINFA